MIYFTGDTHGEFTRLSNRNIKSKGLKLTTDDYLIVCGDLGLCWVYGGTFDYECKFFEKKPYTVLWVQGNHENYDMIREFNLEEWHGGKVRHIVRDKVILLERGQVFRIEGKTFFTFGGASSHDVEGGIFKRSDPDFRRKVKQAKKRGLSYRVLGESWWPEELPTKEEMMEGHENLGKVDNKVDYMITHCCSTRIQNVLDPGPGHLYEPDVLTDYLDQLEEKVSFKHWYFGHYHADMEIDSKHTLLYRAIVSLENRNAVPSGTSGLY